MISQALSLEQAQGLLPGLTWLEWKRLEPAAIVSRVVEMGNPCNNSWPSWDFYVQDANGDMISLPKDYETHTELERAAILAAERLGVPIIRKYGGYA